MKIRRKVLPVTIIVLTDEGLCSSVRHGLTNLQPGPAQAHGL